MFQGSYVKTDLSLIRSVIQRATLELVTKLNPRTLYVDGRTQPPDTLLRSSTLGDNSVKTCVTTIVTTSKQETISCDSTLLFPKKTSDGWRYN